MIVTFHIGAVLVLLSLIGCSGSPGKIGDPGDPQACEVLLAHFETLHRRDWRRAYEQIHPELKAAGLTLKRFTSLYDRRLKTKGAPEKIDVTGSEQSGDDVIVSFDVCAVPDSGGEPVAVSPRRKATLRRSGGSWALLTHDILSVGAQPQL
jgi:hypothetical protein